MGLRPATPLDLDSVKLARDAFRALWASIGPVFSCTFNGTASDIAALDYLDYEGLFYPESGMAGAALVWGNVVACQLPFDWHFDDELGGLILKSREGDLTVWPFGRIYESQWGGRGSSGGKYRRLLDWLVLQCFERHVVGEADPPWLARLFEGGGSGLADTLEIALERLQRLQGDPT